MASNKPEILYRSEQDRIIGGVAAGLADYLGLDHTVARIAFLLIFLFGGSGLILYLILWVVVPTQSSAGKANTDHIKQNSTEIKSKAQNLVGSFSSKKGDKSVNWGGWLLILIGAYFLLQNFGFIGFVDFGKIWPLFLILIGISILGKK